MQTKEATAASAAADLQHLALPANAQVLFASDMHLGEHDPATANWFCAALEERVFSVRASHLVLLGDLFEAWVGDDQTDAVANGLVELIARLSNATPVFVMRGNRDFLLDTPLHGTRSAHESTAPTHQPFSQLAGATMLADPCVLTIAGERWVLTHGDVLCTDDSRYQAFRLESRAPEWQQTFLAQPLSQRMALATQMRAQSEQEKSNKAAYLTDVNQGAVEACLLAHDALRMIHGHTHRPATHNWVTNGHSFVRHVLPDWDYANRAGGFGLLSAKGFETLAAEQANASN
ncbi:MAG: UDP-2,3-diacylglucosamine diphosphatase [Burkholderiaceae bacterium]